jgi:hypothetical protein
MPDDVTLSPKEARVIGKTLMRLAAHDYGDVFRVAADMADGMSDHEFVAFWRKLPSLFEGTN